MATIILAGWREGLHKISLTRLQQELLRLPVKEAKENVDQLLEGRPVPLEVADEVTVNFFERASQLGALLRFSVTGTATQPNPGVAVTPQQAT